MTGAPGLSDGEVRARARSGVRVLLTRLLLTQGIGLVAGIALSRLLGPAPFGTIAMASAAISIVSFTGDLGLRAALIQSFAALSPEELRAVFSLRVLLTIIAGAGALLLGPWLEQVIWGTTTIGRILPVLVIGLVLLEPPRGVATAILERDLRFARITTLELSELIVYYGTALGMTSIGIGGAEALAYGVLARALTGAILGLGLSSWRPSLTLRLGPARRFLRFGVGWQLTQAVYFLNSLLFPVLVGRLAGEAALGLVLWAHGNAGRIMPVLEAVSRVAFPAYARLNATVDVIRDGVQRTIHAALLCSGAYGAVLVGTAPVLVPVLYGGEWVRGTRLLEVFGATFPLVGVTTMLDVSMFAQGRTAQVRNLHAVRLIATVAFGLPATMRWGPEGFALAYGAALVVFTLAEVSCALLNGELTVRGIARAAVGPVVASAAALLVARLTVSSSIGTPTLRLAAGAVAAGFVFVAVELAIEPARFMGLVRALVWRSTPPVAHA